MDFGRLIYSLSLAKHNGQVKNTNNMAKINKKTEKSIISEENFMRETLFSM